MIVALALSIAVLSYLVNRQLLVQLKGLGTRTYAPQVRWASQPKPTIGGVSFFIGFNVSIGFFQFFGWMDEVVSAPFIALSVGALAAFGMGLVDDIRQTGPMSKFLVQIACGAILWFGGLRVDVGPDALNLALTVLLTVTLMNSINMLDNMDGVSGGAAFSTLIGLHFIANEGPYRWLCLGMAAAVAGFLVLNRYPSKLFMGDAGSQLLGFLLAALSIAVFNGSDFGAQTLGASTYRWALLIPLFFTTLCDTALVTVNRLAHRRSPFKGGRDHSTHNLAYLGLSDARIANLFTLWSAVNAFVVHRLMFTDLSAVQMPLILLFITLVGIYATFVAISRVNIKNQRLKYTP